MKFLAYNTFLVGISFVRAAFFSRCLGPTSVVVSPQAATSDPTYMQCPSVLHAITKLEYYMSAAFQPVELTV